MFASLVMEDTVLSNVDRSGGRLLFGVVAWNAVSGVVVWNAERGEECWVIRDDSSDIVRANSMIVR